MSVVLLITVEASSGRRDELRDALNALLPDTRRFDGNESVELLLPRDAADTIILIEQWTSVEAFEAYRAWRAESGETVLTSNLVAAAPVTVVCDR